jgi:hypothetical protein
MLTFLRSEMLEDDEWIAATRVGDANTAGRGIAGDEQFVLCHLAEADHRRRADVMRADGALALHDDQTVRGSVRDGDGAVRKHRELFR